MKFDKFMEHCFRILSVVLSCCVLVASIVSCFSPLSASAEIAVPNWVVPIESYTDSYEESIQEIQKEGGYLATVLNDPNISNEAKRQILIGNALQTFDFKFAVDLLAHWNDNGFPNEPEEIAVSGSGYAGLYYFDNVLYTGVLYPRPENWSITYGASGYQPVCSTPHFTVDIIMEPVNGVSYYYGGNARIYTSGGNGVFKFNASAVFQPYTINGASVDAFWRPAETPPRYYSSSALLDLSRYFNGYQFFLGSAVSVSLPSATVNSDGLWEYYNNTLLPYLRNNVYNTLPSNIDVNKLLVFPNGYTPSVPPNYFDPNVNFNGVGVGGLGGIIAGAGAIINVGGVGSVNVFAPIQGQINIDGIQFQIPLDGDSIFINKLPYSAPNSSIELGDHIIDLVSKTQFLVDGIEYLLNSDGTISIDNVVYNLPIGTPTQLPTDSNEFLYQYEIPTVERIDIVNADLQAPTLSTFGNAINFIWATVYTVLSSTGLFPLVAISLGLGAVGYVLWKIGG